MAMASQQQSIDPQLDLFDIEDFGRLYLEKYHGLPGRDEDATLIDVVDLFMDFAFCEETFLDFLRQPLSVRLDDFHRWAGLYHDELEESPEAIAILDAIIPEDPEEEPVEVTEEEADAIFADLLKIPNKFDAYLNALADDAEDGFYDDQQRSLRMMRIDAADILNFSFTQNRTWDHENMQRKRRSSLVF